MNAEFVNQKTSLGYMTQFNSFHDGDITWRVGIYKKKQEQRGQAGLFFERNGEIKNLIEGFSGFIVPRGNYFLFVSNNQPQQHSASSEVFKVSINDEGFFEIKSLIKKEEFICESVELDDQSVVLISGNYNSGFALKITQDLTIYEVEYYQHN